VVLVGVPTRFAGAADWSLKALISETATYNDNRGLVPISPGGTYGLRTALSLNAMAKTPTCQFSLNGHLDHPYHFGPGAEGLTDRLHFSTSESLKKQVSELTAFTLSASQSSQSTSTTELTDSGEVNLNGTRHTRSFQAGVSHAINRRNSVSLSASLTRISFTGDTGDLVGSTSRSISGSWQHSLTKLTNVTTTVGYSRYSPDDPSISAKSTFSATAGLSSALTRRLSVSGSAGVRKTHVEGAPSTLGWVGHASLNYKRKSTDFSLSASRATSPSSFGELQTSTSYSLKVDHAINRVSHVNLAVTYSDFTSATRQRQLFVASATYGRQVTRNGRAELSYKFTQRHDDTGTATSNSVLLRLSRNLDILH
jgi:hypothetical protein